MATALPSARSLNHAGGGRSGMGPLADRGCSVPVPLQHRALLRGLLAVADGLRAALLHGLFPRLGLTGRALITQPVLRVAVGGSFGVAFALLLTWSMPLLLLAFSPLLLGIPHLVSDIRYLIVQPGYHRRLWLAGPVGLGLLGAAFGLGMRAGLLSTALTLVLAVSPNNQSRWHGGLRRALGLLIVAGLAVIGWRTDWYWLDLAMAHAHNFIAVLLLSLWVSSRTRQTNEPHSALTWAPLGLFLLAAVLLASGGLTARPTGLLALAGDDRLNLDGARWTLAPYLQPDLGTRVVLLFAFAQAVHYTVWLRLLPDVTRERPTPRSFRASVDALHRDLGPGLLAIAGVLVCALIVYACLDVAVARDHYFRIAMFHGHLELCALALWWVEGMPSLPVRRRPSLVAASTEGLAASGTARAGSAMHAPSPVDGNS